MNNETIIEFGFCIIWRIVEISEGVIRYIKHQSYWRNKRTVSPECSNYMRWVRGHAPPENFLKIGISETPCPTFPGSNAIIHTCILLSFSQSLVIHESRAEVQRFMIPKFLKQRFMILTFFVTMIYDSWFRFHPRHYPVYSGTCIPECGTLIR